jgi:glutathione S-transferase
VSSLTLYTIGPSHYCEKARWALERLRIRYTESRHPAIVVYARIAKFRKRTVPLLATRHGIIDDSTAILTHLDSWVEEPARLFPEGALRADVTALEASFDERLGPQTRRLAYAFIVDRPDMFVDMMSAGVSRLDDAALRAGKSVFLKMIKSAFKLEDRDRAIKTATERIRAVFDEVSLRLADGRPFLTGDRFTAADLTFACLAAPAVCPPNYGVPWPDTSTLPEAFRTIVKDLRAMPAGAFAMKMFEMQRRLGAPGLKTA